MPHQSPIFASRNRPNRISLLASDGNIVVKALQPFFRHMMWQIRVSGTSSFPIVGPLVHFFARRPRRCRPTHNPTSAQPLNSSNQEDGSGTALTVTA